MRLQKLPKYRVILYSVILLVLLAAAARQVVARGEAERVSAATVKVTTVVAAPDYAKPWQLKATEAISGSGAIIAGHRILTNAHNVAWAANVEVSRPGLQRTFGARVQHIDHASDLALLSVDDATFFDGVTALEMGGLPRTESAVTAYGYPIGGETVSATSGIVSRFGVDPYVHSDRSLLTMQIDAALNPGNSGGPVVAGGRIVAMAMQGIEDSDNIGYGIPAPVIARFLKDAADGDVGGAPQLGVYSLPLESDAMRDYLHLGATQTGSLVADVDFGSSAWGVLQRDDVIMAVDGIAVANDETVPLGNGTRVDYSNLITTRQVGDYVALTIWRAGAKRDVTVELRRHDQMVPVYSYPARCRYRIAGGIVFQPADEQLVKAMPESMPSLVLDAMMRVKSQTEHQRELVVMTAVLPHDVNRGYQDWAWDVVTTVQGVPVRDFEQFNELLDTATGRWLNLTFDDNSRLVMDLMQVRASKEDILKRFAIPADRYPAEEGSVASR